MAEQFKCLKDEYDRLNRPLDRKTLEEIVADVDLNLSVKATWVVKDHKDAEGNHRQILSNMRSSVWVPAEMQLGSVQKRAEDFVPFVVDSKTRNSHFCIQLFQRLMAEQTRANAEKAAFQNVRLPGSAVATSSGQPLQDFPEKGKTKNHDSEPQGSQSMPGMKMDPQSHILSCNLLAANRQHTCQRLAQGMCLNAGVQRLLPEGEIPVCKCGLPNESCSTCGEGWLQMARLLKKPHTKSALSSWV